MTSKNKTPVKVKTPCGQCHVEITQSQLHSHTGSKTCLRNQLRQLQTKNISESYVPFSQHTELAQLVNLWAIPEGKIVANQFTAYVPVWIADTYKLYRENKGYAGMSLLEFIDKMRASKNENR